MESQEFGIIYNTILLFNFMEQISSNSKIFIIILHLIEFFQIAYFSFQNQFIQFWDGRLYPIIKVFQYFHFGFIDYEHDFLFFQIFFFSLIFIIVILLLMFLFLMIKLFQNKFSIIVTQIFCFGMIIFNHIIIIPLGVLLIKILDCSSNSNSQIQGLTCFNEIFYLYYILSFVIFICMIFLGFLTNFLLCSFNPNKSKLKGKMCTSRYELYFFIKKILLIIVFTLQNPFSTYSVWILLVLNFILSSADYLYLISIQPYFNLFYMKCLKLFRSIELFYSIIVLVCLIINSDYKGDLFLVLIGGFTIAIYQILYKDNQIKYYLNNTEKITVDNSIKKLLILLNFFDNSNETKNYLQGRAIILLQKNTEDLSNEVSRYLIDELSNIIEYSNANLCKL